MENVKIQKVLSYVQQNQEALKGKSLDEILDIMQSSGILTTQDCKELEENSLFNDGNYGVKLDKISFNKDSKIPVQNIEGNIVARHNVVMEKLQNTKSQNGLIGSLWSGFKNLVGVGASSNKVEQAIEREQKLISKLNGNSAGSAFQELTGLEYTKSNLEKFMAGEIKLKSEEALDGYSEGQQMATDIVGDIVSGIAAFSIYSLAIAAAPFTGGASIAIGVGAAAVVGALTKASVKFIDAKIGGREYDSFGRDLATGAFSGVLAPVTGGVGGAVGRGAASKMGLQAVRQIGKETVKDSAQSGFKRMLMNPAGYKYIGESAGKKAIAYGMEMATSGATAGGVDNAFRTAYDGGDINDIGNALVQGTIGGLILSPIIGGGIKVVGKGIGKGVKRVNDNYDKAKAALKNNPTVEKSPDLEMAQEMSRIFKEAEEIVSGIRTDGSSVLHEYGINIAEMSDNVSALLKETTALNTELNGITQENRALINDILKDIATGRDASSKISQLSMRSISLSDTLANNFDLLSNRMQKYLDDVSKINELVSEKGQNGLNVADDILDRASGLTMDLIAQGKKLPETSAFKLFGNLPERIKKVGSNMQKEAIELDKRADVARTKIQNGNAKEGLEELQRYYDEVEIFNKKLEEQLASMQSSAARAGLDESAKILSQRLDSLQNSPIFREMTREQQIQAITENSNILFAKFAQTFSSDKSLPKELTNLLEQFTSNCTVSRNIKQAQTLADELYGAGKYELVKSFGAGTIGETYLAKSVDGKQVVIKMLKQNVTPEKFKQDRAMFTKYIEEFVSDPMEKEYKLNLINGMFDAWDRELNFGLEAQGAKNMAEGATRFSVAQTLEVGSKNGNNISLVMEKANGVQLDKLLRMMQDYNSNPSEYLQKYAKEIAEFPQLKNPKEWMGDLALTYQRAQNEQSMFVTSGGTRTIHADPHAGNIFIDFDSVTGKPKIVYIDTGNVVTRTTSETLDDIALSMNMMFGNSRGIAESFLKGATLPSNTTMEKSVEQFTKLLDERLFKANINIKNSQYTQSTINNIMKELNIIPNADNSNLMKAVLQRMETSRAIKSVCGIKGNDKVDNIKDLATALIKAFKVSPRETWNTIKPILQWAINNKDQAMITFFQMIIKNANL